MTSAKAAVDVLIPVYNAERTIAEAIGSIQGQTLRSIRIIVVDDGSSDRTPEILGELQAADSRIEIIRRPNGGIVDALNHGLSLCSAAYVARFESDDIAYADRLQQQVDYLATHPECVAVSGCVDHMDADGRPLHGLPLPGPPDRANMTSAPALEPYLIHPFLMVRRDALVAAGGYRHVHHSEDSDLYWRLAEQGSLHNLETALGKYRVHAESLSGSSIVNSRIMSISSQLGAISARRRRAGLADLTFSKDALGAYKSAQTLEGMWRIASQPLSEAESGYLRIAASMKLLELAGYRPIMPETSDCRFIRASLEHSTGLAPQDRRQIDWYVTTAAARLMRMGRVKDAALLAPVARYPVALARAVRGR